MARAAVLAALLWPACAIGATIGAVVGVIAGSIGDPVGWAAIGWGFIGVVLGVAVGGLLLGWIWAIVCERRKALPILAVTLLPTVGVVVGLVLILPVPGTDADGLRIAGACAIVVIVTVAIYLVGRAAPGRAAHQGVSGRS